MLNKGIDLKGFMNRILSDVNSRILLGELVLFSILLGAVPHLWPVACLMFLGLSWVLSKPKGAIYMICILSVGWGLMAMGIAYFISGWGWGVTWGAFILICGFGLHFRDLRWPLHDESSMENKKIIEPDQNWFLRGQNLN